MPQGPTPDEVCELIRMDQIKTMVPFFIAAACTTWWGKGIVWEQFSVSGLFWTQFAIVSLALIVMTAFFSGAVFALLDGAVELFCATVERAMQQGALFAYGEGETNTNTAWLMSRLFGPGE
jgi:hypothetical protein